MNNLLRATLLAGSCVVAVPAFAQLAVGTPPPNASQAAPAPTVSAPAPGAKFAMPPLTETDSTFVASQISSNNAEIQAGQLALQRSSNQTVRDYAQKMVTDYSAANGQLIQIASQHGVQTPMGLTPNDQDALTKLAQLDGQAFDRAYIDTMIRAHDTTVLEMNDELKRGLSQYVSAYVQNVRPTVMQHAQLAQQVRDYLKNG
jgi:putative membrane protein